MPVITVCAWKSTTIFLPGKVVDSDAEIMALMKHAVTLGHSVLFNPSSRYYISDNLLVTKRFAKTSLQDDMLCEWSANAMTDDTEYS